jgi:hypothetical protein
MANYHKQGKARQEMWKSIFGIPKWQNANAINYNAMTKLWKSQVAPDMVLELIEPR